VQVMHLVHRSIAFSLIVLALLTVAMLSFVNTKQVARAQEPKEPEEKEGVGGVPGPVGPPGPQGPAGPQGPQGLTGAQGPAGPQRSNGDKGDPGHNGTTGMTGPPGPQGPAGQGVEFGHLVVIKHVININGGDAIASDFTIHVSGNHQSPDTFPASETGTNVTLGFGSYQVTEETVPNALISQHTSTQFSKDCSGVIHPDETKTCTITNIFNPRS
jgi:hypothetical protein